MSEFLLIRQGNRRRLAVPAHRDGNEIFDILSAFTKAGRLWKLIAEASVRSGMGSLFHERVDGSFHLTLQLQCSDWLNEVAKLIPSGIRYANFLFPYDQNRSKFSAILCNHASKKFFAKFAWNGPERIELETEYNALSAWRESQFTGFRIPQIVMRIEILDGDLNVYEFEHKKSNPCRVWNNDTEAVWKELVRRTRVMAPVSQVAWISNCRRLPWWPMGMLGNRDQDIILCATHGDFSPWNLRVGHDGYLFVYDWEQYEASAPYLLDPIHFMLQYMTLVRRWKPTKIAERLLRFVKSISDDNDHYLNLMLALGFLRLRKKSVPIEIVDAVGANLSRTSPSNYQIR